MTTRKQKLEALKNKVAAMRVEHAPPALEIVAPPIKQPQELFLQIGRNRYQVANLRDAVDQYREARRKSGLGASKTPRVTIVNRYGNYLYTVRDNGTIWTVDGRASWVEVAL